MYKLVNPAAGVCCPQCAGLSAWLSGAESKGMKSLLDVAEPRPRRLSSLQEPEMEFSTLADEPLSRAVSHTPPLAGQGGSRPTFDPLEDFSQDTSNLDATDRCLAAACSLLQFQIAEVRFVCAQPVFSPPRFVGCRGVACLGVCGAEEVETGQTRGERSSACTACLVFAARYVRWRWII